MGHERLVLTSQRSLNDKHSSVTTPVIVRLNTPGMYTENIESRGKDDVILILADSVTTFSISYYVSFNTPI